MASMNAPTLYQHLMHIDELIRPSQAQSYPHLLFNLHNCHLNE